MTGRVDALRQRAMECTLLLSALVVTGAVSASPPSTNTRTPSRTARFVSTDAFIALARRLGPSVVNIAIVRPDGDRAPHRGPPIWERGHATGFFLDDKGHIVTNHHVVDGAQEIRVRLADEREFSARLIGSDEPTDLAVIRIEASGPISMAPLGDSDRLEIGEWVVAIGNPLGLDHTVTAGIVSAKGRREVRPGGSTSSFYDFIQTDASINIGNSGGPLINLRGEVVGINTAVNPQANGIAFAIPINLARRIVPELIARGRVQRSWIGAAVQPISSSLQRAFALPDRRGALIAEVVDGSPARAAGLLVGDVVRSIDGQPVHRAGQFDWSIATKGVGRSVEISLLRRGTPLAVRATLAALPEERSPPDPRPTVTRRSPLGMIVSEITDSTARELRLTNPRGVVVIAVEPDGAAADAGLQRGDVVIQIGEAEVLRLDDYAREVRSIAAGAIIKLLVRRSNHQHWIAFPKR